MTFPERLRAARLQRGLTQKQVGDALGLDTNTVSGYETGYTMPRIESIRPMCRVLGVSSDWLLDIPMPTPTTERQQAEYRERIIAAVCIAFGVRREDVLGRRKYAMVVAARQAAMWLILTHTGATLASAGMAFGGRDHTTVIWARDRVEQWRDYDAPLWARVEIALTILGASRAPALGPARVVAPRATSDTPGGDGASCGLPEASQTATLFQPLNQEAA